MFLSDAPHLRILRLRRDEGAVSRAELGDRLELTRPRLLAEVERRVAAGLIAEAGMAASRGGRRSTLVEIHPRLRFAAVDLGASSIDIEVVNGRLEPVATYREPADPLDSYRNAQALIRELLGLSDNLKRGLEPVTLAATIASAVHDELPVRGEVEAARFANVTASFGVEAVGVAGIPGRDEVLERLAAHDIEARPTWKPMHLQPLFRDCVMRGGEVSADLFRRGLCLPSGSALTQHHRERVVAVVREVAAGTEG